MALPSDSGLGQEMLREPQACCTESTRGRNDERLSWLLSICKSDLKALLDFSPVALIFWEERMEGGSF